MDVAQIVERMRKHEEAQNEALEHYRSLRRYQVVYKGFAKTLEAAMEAEVEYSASSGKSYRIVSQSGSKAICEKVLKRAVDSEVEAAQNKTETALTETNYTFLLIGSENVGDRSAYILEVEPKTQSKFLYKGRIWVDEEDFAVVKIEAHPAHNPSFWISRTSIYHTNAKHNGFWLPEHNRSVTKVRIGGTAIMTIDYGTYQIVPKLLRSRKEQ